MWKPNTAVRQSAMTLRYLSDLTDAEWALVELMIPSGRHMADANAQ
jgi:hypothetical protein